MRLGSFEIYVYESLISDQLKILSIRAWEDRSLNVFFLFHLRLNLILILIERKKNEKICSQFPTILLNDYAKYEMLRS